MKCLLLKIATVSKGSFMAMLEARVITQSVGPFIMGNGDLVQDNKDIPKILNDCSTSVFTIDDTVPALNKGCSIAKGGKCLGTY